MDNIDFTKVISLNESAAFLWKQVAGLEFSEEDLVQLLLGEYEVEESQAAEDVKALLTQWKAEGLVE